VDNRTCYVVQDLHCEFQHNGTHANEPATTGSAKTGAGVKDGIRRHSVSERPDKSVVALIIDDELQIRRLLRIMLEGQGYQVYEAKTGQEGLVEAAQCRPEIILLDLGLPDMDGGTVLKRLREWSRVPVVVLSVRDREEDKVAALDAGADDYVTKPFAANELLARLRAAHRHAHAGADAPVFRSGRLEVDLVRRLVTVGGQAVKLTGTEYSLLALFVRNAGRVLTHRQLLTGVWGPKAAEHNLYLRVYMAHLREKLETDPGKPELFITEAGIGYRLMEIGR
jgi:two-component system KDP operon response regulator KdpE